MATIAEYFRRFNCKPDPQLLPLKVNWFFYFLATGGSVLVWNELGTAFWNIPYISAFSFQYIISSVVTYAVVLGLCAYADKRSRHHSLFLYALIASAVLNLWQFAVPLASSRKYPFPDDHFVLKDNVFTCNPSNGSYIDVCGDFHIASFPKFQPGIGIAVFHSDNGHYVKECDIYCNFTTTLTRSNCSSTPCFIMNEETTHVDNSTINDLQLLEFTDENNTMTWTDGNQTCSRIVVAGITQYPSMRTIHCDREIQSKECSLRCRDPPYDEVPLVSDGGYWVSAVVEFLSFVVHHVCLITSVDVTMETLGERRRLYFSGEVAWSAIGYMLALIVSGLVTFWTQSINNSAHTPWTVSVFFIILFRILLIVNAKKFIKYQEQEVNPTWTQLRSFIKRRKLLFLFAAATTLGFLNGCAGMAGFWYWPGSEYSFWDIGFMLDIPAFFLSAWLILKFGQVKLYFALIGMYAMSLIVNSLLHVRIPFPGFLFVLHLTSGILTGIAPAIAITCLVTHTAATIVPGHSAFTYAFVLGAYFHLGHPTGGVLREVIMEHYGTLVPFLSMCTICTAAACVFIGMYFAVFKRDATDDGAVSQYQRSPTMQFKNMEET